MVIEIEEFKSCPFQCHGQFGIEPNSMPYLLILTSKQNLIAIQFLETLNAVWPHSIESKVKWPIFNRLLCSHS